MEVGNMILSLTTRAHRLGPFPLDSCFTTQQLSFQSFHQVRFQLQHVTLNVGLIKHCYSENKGKDQDRGEGGVGREFSWQSPKVQTQASSDEENDAFRHHDLVVVLHFGQRCLDLLWREGLVFVLVDGFCEAIHAH